MIILVNFWKKRVIKRAECHSSQPLPYPLPPPAKIPSHIYDIAMKKVGIPVVIRKRLWGRGRDYICWKLYMEDNLKRNIQLIILVSNLILYYMWNYCWIRKNVHSYSKTSLLRRKKQQKYIRRSISQKCTTKNWERFLLLL